MKQAILGLIMLVMLSSMAFADTPGTAPWESDCTANGFDYGIAKYECGSLTPSEGDGSNITIQWYHETGKIECEAIYWHSDFYIDAAVSKEATDYFIHDGGTDVFFEKDGQHAISHVTFCGKKKKPVDEVPEFSTITAGLALVGVAGFMAFKRRGVKE